MIEWNKTVKWYITVRLIEVVFIRNYIEPTHVGEQWVSRKHENGE